MSTGYDLLLEKTGVNGIYQRRKLVCMYFASILLFMPRLTWIFLGAVPSHRCLLPNEDLGGNFSLPYHVLNESIPWDARNQQWSRCSMFESNRSDFENRKELQCHKFVYDRSVHLSSVVQEWDLVCDRSWMRATAQAVFDGGNSCGAIFLGVLSDKIGRKNTLFLSILAQSLSGTLAGLMPEFYSFMVLQFVVGFTSAGASALYILGVEFLGPKDRTIPGIIFNFFFTFSYFLFLVYAYFIDNWRALQVSVSLTSLILMPSWWLIPESNRWLITKGKLHQAKRSILQIAKTNKTNVDPAVVDQILQETYNSNRANNSEKKRNERGVRDLVRHPQLLFIAMKVCFLRFACNAAFWGLSLNVSNLGGNVFINFLISGAIEFPANASLFVFDKYMGRRVSLWGLCFAAGSTLVATAFVPENMTWLTIFFAMIGKMVITAAFALVYIYASELYPTVVRNAAMGISSTAGKIGGMAAPYILLLADTWKPLPMIIYGCLALVGGLLALLLPETKGKPLPETIDDMYLITKKRSTVETETTEQLSPNSNCCQMETNYHMSATIKSSQK